MDEQHCFSRQKNHKHYPLWLYMGIIFTTLVIVMWFALGFSSYHMVKKTSLTATNQLAEQITRIAELSLEAVQRSAYVAIETLSNVNLAEKSVSDLRLHVFPLMAADLRALPVINSIFISYENGDFFVVRALRTESEIALFNAPAKAFFIVQSVEHRLGNKTSNIFFYDEKLLLLAKQEHPEDAFDPRTRDWHMNAIKITGHSFTDPYFFYGTSELGITVARRSSDLQRVIGLDMSLYSLSQMLDTQLPTPHSRMAIVTSDGALVAHTSGLPKHDYGTQPILTREGTPILLHALEEYKKGQRGLLDSIEIDRESWLFYVDEIGVFGSNRRNLLLIALPINEVMKDNQALLRRTLEVSFLILLICLPCIWYATNHITNVLSDLFIQAQKIRDFHFDNEESFEPAKSNVTEFYTLSCAIFILKNNIKRFLNINSAISNERNFDKLLDIILVELSEVANAEGGFISFLDEHGQYLPDVKIYWNKLIDNSQNPERISSSQFEAIMPTTLDLSNHKPMKTTIKRSNAISSFAAVFNDPKIEHLDIIHLPLSNKMGEHLGVLSFVKKIYNSQNNFQSDYVSFIKTLADVVTVALEDHRLLKAEQNLLDAMVRIIAGAIDAKSPYTGAHCQRVPIIFSMILEAANKTAEGPFKNFSLTDDEREEANLAAWLHDCGKVTTPEYVIDKATKLETIYDRIHEIRMRFEVLKRDVEIGCLRDILEGASREDRNEEAMEKLKELDNDFAFVAQCNIGSEFLDNPTLERLQTIGQRTWMRTLDKRLGVGRDERTRMGEDSELLPVSEKLLSDKNEHLITHSSASNLDEYSALGIKTKMPMNLYNRGELCNLSVARGTLNFEERYKINDHTTQTILMLNKLPLPKRMKNVPNLAGNHHETLDGKGYPRQLHQEDIDIKTRMLAIADIFEALTAADRPYKPAKTLSEALTILKIFQDNKHIDSDVYELFIKENIPQKYAKKYLLPEQYDI